MNKEALDFTEICEIYERLLRCPSFFNTNGEFYTRALRSGGGFNPEVFWEDMVLAAAEGLNKKEYDV